MIKNFDRTLNDQWLKNNLDYIMQVKTKYGPLYLLKNDRYITQSFKENRYWGENEVLIINDFLKFRNKKKPTYLDIGSNIGSHILAISYLFNHDINIFSFEPQTYVFNLLKANLFENNLNNVNFYNKAVSDKNEILEIKILNHKKNNNFGGLELITPKISDNHDLEFLDKTEKIETIKLDSFIETDVDFIKMDIEGMEHLAIKGAMEIIKKNKPVLLIELKKTEINQILNFFREEEYSAYFIKGGNGLFVPNYMGVQIKNLERIL